jgi:metal-dependent amidase/aminoacylase/carboxypeptidase family protein
VDDQRILAAVESKRESALAAHRFVHEHPELSHAEHECSRYLCDVLEEGGLDVERGLAGMATAFRATLRGSKPGRSVGLVALYDAVPVFRPDGTIEPVHSCGHDAIPAGVVATALAFADLREDLPGSLVVFGCPADEIPAPLTVEIGGGKAVSAAAGLWNGIDAALYAHPEFEDTVFLRSRWMRRDRAMVTGTRSLTGEPESPIEAVLAAVGAVKALPPADAIVEHIAFEGDVEEGGGLVVRIHFLLRADEEAELDDLAEPLRAALPDAAWSSDPVVCGLRPDPDVTLAVKEAVLALGGEFVDDPAQLPFGTDFGNVSQRVPSALIGIGRPGGWAFHTDEGAVQFAQDGEECALSIARVLSLTSTRLLEPRNDDASLTVVSSDRG